MGRLSNIAEILFGNAGRGEALAIRSGETALKYGELIALAGRAGNGLKALGLERENRVALLLFDSPEFIASFFGAAAIGAAPVPLSTSIGPGDCEYLLNHSRAKVVIVSAALHFLVDAVRARCPELRHVIVVGEEKPKTLDWQRCIEEASADLTLAATSPDEPAFWLYSSGSAGRPKAVVHVHSSARVACEQYAKQVLGLTSADICFSAAKLFHAYGLGNGMNFPLYVGASSILWPGPPLAESLFEQITRWRPTVFFATPSLFVSMLGVANAERRYDLSSVRFCVSAGEALPAATFARWKEKFGLEILDGIGSTEMLHIFISNRRGHARAGSSGQIVPGYDAKIVDEQETPVACGEIGDLWVRGGSSAACYWNNRARTQATMRGEWIVTGDKYHCDADGYFWHDGRADDMLKVNGLWVSPLELEVILNEHAKVAESAVVGLRDPDGLIQSKAFVVLRPGVEASPALIRELRGFVKERAPQRYPKMFEFVSQLPKTATGKIKRFELRGAGAAV